MSAEGFGQLAALVTQPLVIVSTDGTVLAANDAAVRLGVGLAPGCDLQDALAVGEAPKPALRTCVRQGGVVPLRLRLRAPADDFPGPARAARVEVGDEPAVAILLPDEGQPPFAQLNDRLRRLQREVRYRTAAEAQRDAALRAERAARRRLASLQQLTGALSSAADIDAVTGVVLSTGVDELQAQEARVYLLDDWGETFEVAGFVGADERAVDRWCRFPREPGTPLDDALDRKEPVVWESLADRDRQYPTLRGDPLANDAYIIVPMVVETREVGALVFGFAGPKDIDETDREFVCAAADQTAQAVVRARLHENEARAHRHQSFLAEAGMLLARSLRNEDILSEIAALSVPTLADGCVVHLAHEEGLRSVAAAHADPERRALLDRLLASGSVLRNPYILEVAETGQSRLLSTVSEEAKERIAQSAGHRAMIERLGVTSALAVALTARGRTLGTLMLFNSDDRRRLSERELAVAEDLAARAALAIDNARLYGERSEVARVLQHALLPPELPTIPGVGLAARHEPASDMVVGGDFYDVFEGPDRSWTVLIGDVCGKDAVAATLTGLSRHTARAVTVREAAPREVLEVMNEAFGRYDSNELFCTAVCARVRPRPSGVAVELVVAGHPPPALLRADGTVEVLEPMGQPVGLFADIDLHPVTLDLGPGDALVLYTDGVTEARRGDEMFGEDGLREALRRHGPGAAGDLADHLLAELDRYEGGERGDDTAIVVITAEATAEATAEDTAEATAEAPRVARP